MKCRICGKEINAEEKFCKYCGEPNDNLQKTTDLDNSLFEYAPEVTKTPEMGSDMQQLNNVAMTLGIIGLVLFVIGLFIFGILEFVALGLSIGGLVTASRNKKKGYPYNGAFAICLIGVIFSSIICLLLIISLILLFSIL